MEYQHSLIKKTFDSSRVLAVFSNSRLILVDYTLYILDLLYSDKKEKLFVSVFIPDSMKTKLAMRNSDGSDESILAVW